jgi:hypothetical protein
MRPNRRLVAVTTVIVLLAAAGLAALATGIALPGFAVGSEVRPAGPDSGGDTADSNPDAELTDVSTAPFAFAVESVEQCGRTCSDVTTSLTNQQTTGASDVVVDTHIYAGNGTSGDPVWTGEESVGTLGAGESYTAVERVDLSLSDALAIERNDGWITVETTVRSNAEAMTTVERREVA